MKDLMSTKWEKYFEKLLTTKISAGSPLTDVTKWRSSMETEVDNNEIGHVLKNR